MSNIAASERVDHGVSVFDNRDGRDVTLARAAGQDSENWIPWGLGSGDMKMRAVGSIAASERSRPISTDGAYSKSTVMDVEGNCTLAHLHFRPCHDSRIKAVIVVKAPPCWAPHGKSMGNACLLERDKDHTWTPGWTLDGPRMDHRWTVDGP